MCSTRRGSSLLEVIAAGTVLAIALVPALALLRQALDVGEQIEAADAMTTLCASRLEESLARTAATWNTTSESGDYTSLDYPNLKYSVTKSDAPANGGITDRLIAITATVWDDTDANGAHDASEKSVQFSSKIAKMAVYNESGS